ncbi:MAG: SOS response-associated peptidase [Elusimicrobia bacterium CG08_land_8_20_14_0_20_51_18]|nr:MAG: SOS response-associated peptidase [Elusimicrobia bacterium CG08_land_8_20_14_0_20_51_18]
MCGRFSLNKTLEELLREFPALKYDGLPVFGGNISPGSEISAICGGRLEKFKWGLYTDYIKDFMINVRAEGVASKPYFRNFFYGSRCLIPADAFYEWKAEPEGNAKTPYRIAMKDGSIFFMAGLFNQNNGTCAVITTTPSLLVKQIHDRMPAILTPENRGAWLDRKCKDSERLLPMLTPFDSRLMTAEKFAF